MNTSRVSFVTSKSHSINTESLPSILSEKLWHFEWNPKSLKSHFQWTWGNLTESEESKRWHCSRFIELKNICHVSSQVIWSINDDIRNRSVCLFVYICVSLSRIASRRDLRCDIGCFKNLLTSKLLPSSFFLIISIIFLFLDKHSLSD